VYVSVEPQCYSSDLFVCQEQTDEERDTQYKKLVDLLSKSTFYTNVLRKKLEAVNKATTKVQNTRYVAFSIYSRIGQLV